MTEVSPIMALLKDLSRQTDEFAQATGLRCKEGCGKCCENPDVETTVVEVMPLALHLWETGGAQEIWDGIESRKDPDDSKRYRQACVFYTPDPVVAGNGRCSIYEFRPGICRLFGFATKRGKAGQKQLVTCRMMKENFSVDCGKAQEHIDAGQPVASLSDHGFKVRSLDPHWGKELLPINEAVKIAVERVSFTRR